MASLGMPFQGLIWYFVEDSYGSGPPNSVTDTTAFCISSKVQNVRISTGDVHEEIRGIDSSCVCELHGLATDYTLHLEYHPQCSDRLLRYVSNRWHTAAPLSDCTFDSLAFSIGTNLCITDTGAQGSVADATNYYLTGCKPKTVNIAAAFNNLYTVTIDFSVRSIYTDGQYTNTAWTDFDGYLTDSGAMIGTEPCCCTDAGPNSYMGRFLGFNCAGSIQKGGADVAYIVDAVNITFDYDLQDLWDHDSMLKQYAIPGAIGATGTLDLSLNEGGGVHWSEVINKSPWNLIMDLGGTGCPRLTLPQCEWKSTEVELDVSSEPMMHSVPFTCHPGAWCTDGFWSRTP
jgi:hypothetical protein